MNKTKATKRALLMSMLSMLLCVAMLIGSTFAWFTDSVTSGRNQIVAGNLDVELEYAPKDAARTSGAIDESAWKTVESVTDLLGGALWEPGHTEYVYLRVRNNGSLALKYSLAANVYGTDTGEPEKTYHNIDGDEFQLSKYLVFNVKDGTDEVAKREDLWISDSDEETAAMGKLDSLKADGEVLYPAESGAGASEKAFTLAVYMPTTVGNVANWAGATKYPGESAPEIYFGFDLEATQTPYEEDSFDKNYDKKAEGLLIKGEYYATSPSELKDDLKNAKPGETVVVRDDIVVDRDSVAITGTDVHLNLAGNAIVRDSASGNGMLIGSNSGSAADVTIENGQFVSEKGGNVIRFENGSTATFRDCDFICEAAGSTGNTLIKNYNTSGAPTTVTFENCTFDQGYIDIQGPVNLVFRNCKFNWEDKNGSHFVQVSNDTYGSISLEDCSFNYTDWWSGDLVEIGSIAKEQTMTVTLKNITVTGTGSKTPCVVGCTFSSYSKQIEFSATGTNSYKKDDVEKWENYEKDWK